MDRLFRNDVEYWPLARPFRISRGVKTVAEIVTVEIVAGEIGAGGIVGRGEAVPYARYGETPESVIAQLEGVRGALEAGVDRDGLAGLLPAGAARNAADCALWDIELRSAARSADDRPTPAVPAPAVSMGALAMPTVTAPTVTALTVGLDTPAAMSTAAAALADMPLLKVKLDAVSPEACLRAVRAAAPRPRLIVDPNESWDIVLLARLQPLLAELGVDFVEQPVPASEDAGLAGFAHSVPICADEAAHTAADLPGLRDRYDLVNIKLDKTGGLTEALHMLDAARALGFGVMVGCMICTSLAIAPALRIAARGDFADLDGPLWLERDRDGGVRLDAGRLLPPAPGLWGGAA